MSDTTFFVGIGAQQAGSSWLGRYLFAHPEVWSNPVREMHLFDRLYAPASAPDMAGWYANRREQSVNARDAALALPDGLPRAVALEMHEASIDAIEAVVRLSEIADPGAATRGYVEYFEQRVTAETTCFGELTPAYALLPATGFEALLEVRPDTKILFILRDPVDRHWSGLRQRWYYDKTWDAVAEFDRVHRHDRHVLRSRYDRTFEALDRAVPSDQVLAVFYEELFDPTSDATLRRVTDFLGIDPHDAERGAVVHPGSPAVMTEAQEATTLELLAPTYRAVADRFDSVPPRWRERLARLS